MPSVNYGGLIDIYSDYEEEYLKIDKLLIKIWAGITGTDLDDARNKMINDPLKGGLGLVLPGEYYDLMRKANK